MSNRNNDIRLYLTDIIESIDKIESYVVGISFEEFFADERTKDAVLRNLQVIGEAVKNIPLEIRDKHISINWKAITGMRNKLIHEYFGVSFAIVWETILIDLPPLKNQIERLLKEIEE